MNVHPSLSSPSFSSYCDDDKDDDNDEPISTYILQFVCFSFATFKHKPFKHNGNEKKKNAFRGTVVQCCILENNRLKNRLHILILSFNAFCFGSSSVNGSGCEDSNLIFV